MNSLTVTLCHIYVVRSETPEYPLLKHHLLVLQKNTKCCVCDTAVCTYSESFSYSLYFILFFYVYTSLLGAGRHKKMVARERERADRPTDCTHSKGEKKKSVSGSDESEN